MAENAIKQTGNDLPTTPEQLLAAFDTLGLSYSVHEHEPTFTVAESEYLKAHIAGAHCRNLFVRDKKHEMFLVVAQNETAIDLKKLQILLGCGRLSFGSEGRLWTYLGVRSGSVCPFSVVNDTEGAVQVVLEKAMMEADIVNYHPLVNHLTVGMPPGDLIKFLRATGHEPVIMDLTSAAPKV